MPANAEGLTFTSQNFVKVSFADYSFSNCVFEKCDFTDSSFENASLWGCTFKQCNFSLVLLKECRKENVLFEESKLIGINFSRCNTLIFSINARKSFFQYCNFSALSMKEVSFKDSKIYQCRFIDALLEKACFTQVDLNGTTFHNCDLRESNFEGALNYCINPCENKIKKAKFSFPECIGLLKSLDITIIE